MVSRGMRILGVGGLVSFCFWACSAGDSSLSEGESSSSTGTGAGGNTSGEGGFHAGAAGGAGGTGGAGGVACNPGAGGAVFGDEVCGNGQDENGNGFIDEDCSCVASTTQACTAGIAGLCENAVGTQTCVPSGEFGAWGPCEGLTTSCLCPLDESCEVCGNGLDDDCDSAIDEDCVLDVTVNIDGDCVTAQCPPQAPYPIACNIVMAGGDSRGCVANAPGSSVVYFQEGDVCGAGHVSGTLTCSSVQGAPLDETNCPINKAVKYYPDDPSGCPAT